MNHPSLTDSVARALTFLQTTPTLWQAPPLVQALVLDAVHSLPAGQPLAARVATQLQSQVGALLQAGPLAEAFTVLGALHAYRPALVTGQHIGLIGQRLIACELATGGPYAEPGTEPSIAANAAIAAFITDYSQPLPGLTDFFAACVAADRYEDAQFRPLFVAGLVAQTQPVSGLERLAQFVDQQSRRSAVDQALHCQLLHRLQHSQTKMFAELLLARQRPDGSWPTGKLGPQAKASACLTTALALQALLPHCDAPAAQAPASSLSAVQQAVFARARQELITLPSPLRQLCSTTLNHMQTADNQQEVSLLPHFFAAALQHNQADRELTTLLGAANIYFWLSNVIDDDFLDQEGDPQLVPVANVAMRICLKLYQEASSRLPDFLPALSRVFDELDNANAWEVQHCRFAVTNAHIAIGQLPRFGARRQLADHAFAHMLGPVALLLHSDVSAHSQTYQDICQALRHYLIARQMNDDLYDWHEDLQAGQISYTVACLLRDAGISPGSHRLAQLVPQLERTFWRRTLPAQCRTALQHLRTARRLLGNSQRVQMSDALAELFETIEQPALTALADHSAQRQFLRTYQTLPDRG